MSRNAIRCHGCGKPDPVCFHRYSDGYVELRCPVCHDEFMTYWEQYLDYRDRVAEQEYADVDWYICGDDLPALCHNCKLPCVHTADESERMKGLMKYYIHPRNLTDQADVVRAGNYYSLTAILSCYSSRLGSLGMFTYLIDKLNVICFGLSADEAKMFDLFVQTNKHSFITVPSEDDCFEYAKFLGQVKTARIMYQYGKFSNPFAKRLALNRNRVSKEDFLKVQADFIDKVIPVFKYSRGSALTDEINGCAGGCDGGHK